MGEGDQEQNCQRRDQREVDESEPECEAEGCGKTEQRPKPIEPTDSGHRNQGQRVGDHSEPDDRSKRSDHAAERHQRDRERVDQEVGRGQIQLELIRKSPIGIVQMQQDR